MGDAGHDRVTLVTPTAKAPGHRPGALPCLPKHPEPSLPRGTRSREGQDSAVHEPSARRHPQHNRHPNRPPQVRTITVPGFPPCLRTGPLGGDRLRLPMQAHPTSTPRTRFVFLGTQISPRVFSRSHLTVTPLPPARGWHHLFPRGLPPPSNCPYCGFRSCFHVRFWPPISGSPRINPPVDRCPKS